MEMNKEDIKLTTSYGEEIVQKLPKNCEAHEHDWRQFFESALDDFNNPNQMYLEEVGFFCTKCLVRLK